MRRFNLRRRPGEAPDPRRASVLMAACLQCPPRPRVIAVRAGRLFDSKTGQMLTKQVVVIAGDRITEVGPEGQVKIPAGAQVIDFRTRRCCPA